MTIIFPDFLMYVVSFSFPSSALFISLLPSHSYSYALLGITTKELFIILDSYHALFSYSSIIALSNNKLLMHPAAGTAAQSLSRLALHPFSSQNLFNKEALHNRQLEGKQPHSSCSPAGGDEEAPFTCWCLPETNRVHLWMKASIRVTNGRAFISVEFFACNSFPFPQSTVTPT